MYFNYCLLIYETIWNVEIAASSSTHDVVIHHGITMLAC